MELMEKVADEGVAKFEAIKASGKTLLGMTWEELTEIKAEADELAGILEYTPAMLKGFDLDGFRREVAEAVKTPGIRKEAQLALLRRELDALNKVSASRALFETCYDHLCTQEALVLMTIREDSRWSVEPLRVGGGNLYRVPVVVVGTMGLAHAVSLDGVSDEVLETTAGLFGRGRDYTLSEAFAAAEALA